MLKRQYFTRHALAPFRIAQKIGVQFFKGANSSISAVTAPSYRTLPTRTGLGFFDR
jgi:hypothetical protein